MTTIPAIPLALADLVLLRGVVLTLAQISGDDAVVLSDILATAKEHLSANNIADTAIDPALRDSELGKTVVNVSFSPQSAMLVRYQLFAKVKAFTAADIDQVLKIRRAFDDAFAAAKPTEQKTT